MKAQSIELEKAKGNTTMYGFKNETALNDHFEFLKRQTLDAGYSENSYQYRRVSADHDLALWCLNPPKPQTDLPKHPVTVWAEVFVAAYLQNTADKKIDLGNKEEVDAELELAEDAANWIQGRYAERLMEEFYEEVEDRKYEQYGVSGAFNRESEH